MKAGPRTNLKSDVRVEYFSADRLMEYSKLRVKPKRKSLLEQLKYFLDGVLFFSFAALTAALATLGGIALMIEHFSSVRAMRKEPTIDRPPLHADRGAKRKDQMTARPPVNAEYLLYLVLPRNERNLLIGDLIESYGRVLERFNKHRADIWFYKQVIWSFGPLLRRQILRVGALLWLGRILRRLIS